LGLLPIILWCLARKQRENFMKIPEEDWALGSYYTFSKEDLELINKHRRDENKLGFAVQLAVLRFPGWPFTHVKSIPKSVIKYIANQLELNYSSILNYPHRENTLWSHLKEIRETYDYTSFTDEEHKKTFEYIFKLSLENEDTIHLITMCLNFLRINKIIFPAITTLEKIVWEARLESENYLLDMVSNSLSSLQKESLDNLLSISNENSSKTPLGWLKGVIRR
jgi:TnpA family transposase